MYYSYIIANINYLLYNVHVNYTLYKKVQNYLQKNLNLARPLSNLIKVIFMKKTIMETNKGTIILEMFEKDAPKTVANFEKLANDEFYDGLTFHRVISDFVIQGGCPKGDGTGGPGYSIKCETKGNPRKHGTGAMSMAHAGKDTGGSQFFITHSPQPHLDGVHTVFGQVIEGMDVVNKIKPRDVMKKVRVVEE